MMCGICLQEDDDMMTMTSAPCGFKGALYHVRCLEQMRRVQKEKWRCPHCNVDIFVVDKSSVKRRLECAMEEWMNQDDVKTFWSLRRPIYVQMQAHGMLHGEEEEKAHVLVVSCLVEKMKKKSAGTCVKVTSNQASGTFVSCMLSHCMMLKLTLHRTAYYGKRGCILWDGYSVSACKTRVSPRRKLL